MRAKPLLSILLYSFSLPWLLLAQPNRWERRFEQKFRLLGTTLIAILTLAMFDRIIQRMDAEGQTLTEFTICCIVLALSVSLVSILLHKTWNQFACAYQVFEEVHRQLIHSSLHEKMQGRGAWRFQSQISIEEHPHYVRGTGRCAGKMETVILPKLESAQW